MGWYSSANGRVCRFLVCPGSTTASTTSSSTSLNLLRIPSLGQGLTAVLPMVFPSFSENLLLMLIL